MLGAHAAGDDDLAIFSRRRADGRERFDLGAIEKAASVHDDGGRAIMRSGEFIALRPQAVEDLLTVDKRLGAAERHE